MKLSPRWLSTLALLLCWLGYFSPWVWPPPAALRLSAYDLVEWLTFMQSVRDGTYPITRLDLLWPLVGIALLTALMITNFSGKLQITNLKSLISNKAVVIFSSLALFAAFLILPAYPFVLTAYRDPDLGPQFWLAIVTGLAVIGVIVGAVVRPAWAILLMPLIAIISLLTTLRAFLITRQPIADVLTQPAPPGYGFVLAVLGFSALGLLGLRQIALALRRQQ